MLASTETIATVANVLSEYKKSPGEDGTMKIVLDPVCPSRAPTRDDL
jgi:hydroxymethylpyrimidine/phosphomethylpyrimidine kinase